MRISDWSSDVCSSDLAHADQIRSAPPEERTALGDTPYSLAELRWSLAHEAVVHLDDLLLRRTRNGLVSAQGGAALLPLIGEVCRQVLGWDDSHWLRYIVDNSMHWPHNHHPTTPIPPPQPSTHHA